MRAAWTSLALVATLGACGGGARAVPEVVVVPPAPVAAASPAVAVRTPSCRVAGTGDLADAGSSFAVYPSRWASGAAFVVREPWRVHVTWWDLPRAGGGEGPRARVELGGQHLVRYDGYASLEGRTFQVRRRAFVVPDHVWITGGSSVALVGARGDEVVVRATTAFASPGEVTAVTRCDNVAYEPEELPAPVGEGTAPSGTFVQNHDDTLLLAASPGGARAMTLILQPDTVLSLDVLGTQPGWVRVGGAYRGVGFDGWVGEREVTQLRFRVGLGRTFSSVCGGAVVTDGTEATVTHDAPLYLGKDGSSPLAGATVEQGARVMLVGGREHGRVQFTFEDGEIAAPAGDAFWVAADALE